MRVVVHPVVNTQTKQGDDAQRDEQFGNVKRTHNPTLLDSDYTLWKAGKKGPVSAADERRSTPISGLFSICVDRRSSAARELVRRATVLDGAKVVYESNP